jgi:hypothetical protein
LQKTNKNKKKQKELRKKNCFLPFFLRSLPNMRPCTCICEGRWFVLFCSYEIHWTGMFQIVFLMSFESSRPGGVHGLWFHDVWSCDAKVPEYWMIFSLKIKLNPSWKFQRNWNVPWVLLERSWWAGFNEIHL